jgi:uncharacterized protein
MPNPMTSNMTTSELPVIIDCQEEQLIGLIHQTQDKNPAIGMLLIVGGPQYRVGSHRQFVLLARELASSGIPTLRFDVRGMGDSTGSPRHFGQIDDDLRAAIDCFFKYYPTMQRIVLWGLCDGASAALFYGYQDSRVCSLIILNPWVFTEKGAAKTYLKHYYLQRLLNRDFWIKLLSFKFNYIESAQSLCLQLKRLISARQVTPTSQTDASGTKINENLLLPIRMRECFNRFKHPILIILSGRDLTAEEFKETVASDPLWQELLNTNSVCRREIPEADHTFSTAKWRDQVTYWTKEWISDLA